MCFCPKIKFFGNLWRSLAASKYWPFFKILYRLPEGLERFQKKGKSSEFNPQDYEKVQSSPALTVWSHESVKDCRKTRFWGKNTKFLKIQKKSQDQNRSIFRLPRSISLQNSWRNFKKSNRLATVKLQKKKSDRYCSFSPSWADLPI